MSNTKMLESMSPKLREVAKRANERPEERFSSLAHLIDVQALKRAYRQVRKGAAVGVDGVTKTEYGRNLESNLRDLHQRMKSKRYRHQPIRRVQIPKGDGTTRSIGVSCLEDKIVQRAIATVLEAVYEQDFLDCSHGFRRGRSPHDAVRILNRAVNEGEVKWILETDVASFFDSIDRTKLMEMLKVRITDGSMLRLIGKCLHVGVLDGGEYSTSNEGTAQGSSLSPLLGNIYLHYVLDLWFEREVVPRLHGKAKLIRFADDLVIGFEHKEDAERVMDVLPKRMARYGLTLHPDKTRLLPFTAPSQGQQEGKGPATMDFLGFCFYWRRSRKGTWKMWCKTRHARRKRALRVIGEWCRRHRHRPLAVQHAALKRRVEGHFNYFGVNGNLRQLSIFVDEVKLVWIKWLRRRSQRTRLTWERWDELRVRFPLPRPRITVQIW